jgi:hypothetical protein
MIRAASLSLTELLPINGKIPKGHLLVIMKSYFDGGNQADSTQYDVVTLATVCGTPEQWGPLEGEWRRKLKKHNNAPCLHTTDAVGLTGEFSKKKGWNGTSRDAFILDCVKTIERHMTYPKRPDMAPKFGIVPFTVTIVLKDFIKAREYNPDVPKDANEVLATTALYRCLEWGSEILMADWYHLFFDQNEPFRGHVSDRTRNPKAVKQIPLLDRIVMKGEVDMRVTPALQVADLFAWCVSHKNALPRYEWQDRLLSHKYMDEWLEYDKLVKPIQQTVDIVKQWKLPSRKPTR